MQKFWKNSLIPKELQKVIEDTMKEAEAISRSGIPTTTPDEILKKFAIGVKEARKVIREKESRDSNESPQLKENESPLEDIAEEKETPKD